MDGESERTLCVYKSLKIVVFGCSTALCRAECSEAPFGRFSHTHRDQNDTFSVVLLRLRGG